MTGKGSVLNHHLNGLKYNHRQQMARQHALGSAPDSKAHYNEGPVTGDLLPIPYMCLVCLLHTVVVNQQKENSKPARHSQCVPASVTEKLRVSKVCDT